MDRVVSYDYQIDNKEEMKMINLTDDECIAVIKVSKLMSQRFDTLSLKDGFAWEIFDDHVNLDDFMSAAIKIKEYNRGE